MAFGKKIKRVFRKYGRFMSKSRKKVGLSAHSKWVRALRRGLGRGRQLSTEPTSAAMSAYNAGYYRKLSDIM